MLSLVIFSAALANERHFTYTYESDVLPAQAVEIEPWTTLRPVDGGLRLDHRLEFEGGVSNKLMTALYLNWTAEPVGLSWGGVSSEWKLNLLSRTLKPVGFALYGEVTAAPTETVFEAKLLVDKITDHFVFAANLVGEAELVNVAGAVETAIVQETVLGIAYRPAPVWSVGVELKDEFVFADTAEHDSLFVGPAVAWSNPGWWVAVSGLGLIPVATAEEDTLRARVIMGFHL